jgi:hypothetical protein
VIKVNDVAARLAAMMATALLITGCATGPERSESTWPANTHSLREISATLPGDYSTSLTREQRLNGHDPLVLNVRREALIDQDRIAFTLTQRRGNEPPRAFLLGLEPGSVENELTGLFAPLDESGQTRRQCTMLFTVRSDGFSGQSDPESCRFGEGDQATGLLKEIAFDGSQLVIGDRLVRLPGGETVAEDQVHAFFRVRHFSGWGGRMENGDWRLARDFDLHSAAGYIEPLDAAGMSLGFGLELSRHTLSAAGQHILRLTLTDLENGEILAQSWADPEAESIGIALPDMQVGLDVTTD